MKDTLISFETAKLTKEKGFNISIQSYYSLEEAEDEADYMSLPRNWNAWSKYISAPTQSLLQKWLMNIHKIRVYPTHGVSGEFNYQIYKWNYDNQIGKWQRIGHISSVSTYDEALELGLIHALNLI